MEPRLPVGGYGGRVEYVAVSDRLGKSRLVGPDEAATLLDLTPDGVSALVKAGYLTASTDGPDSPRFAIGDLKAFVARNADSGAGNLFDTEGGPADPQALLAALDGRSEEMARRAFDIFATAFPEASSWGPLERQRFIEQAATASRPSSPSPGRVRRA